MRAFLAIKIADTAMEPLLVLQENLKKTQGKINWVKANNLHVTLLFLGELEKNILRDMASVIEERVANVRSFPLNFSGTGVFPLRGNPRVIWAGIGQGKEELHSLYTNIIESLAQANLKVQKPFSPHLTLGRIKELEHNSDLLLRLANEREFSTPVFSVDTFYLFSSKLTARGPIYTVLKRFKLT